MPTLKETRNHGVPWEAHYGYAQAVKTGDLLVLSGQVGHDETGAIVGDGDMEAQMRQAYVNAVKLLADFGATIDDVIDETLYVTDMEAAFEARVTMKNEIYGGTTNVASTIVEINRLAMPELLVEIRFLARVKDNEPTSGK